MNIAPNQPLSNVYSMLLRYPSDVEATEPIIRLRASAGKPTLEVCTGVNIVTSAGGILSLRVTSGR